MFKVVADQLRISEGWVRCGHCQQVFDASAHLQPVQPPALMPDMALDKVRPPPQPVPRAEPPARAWGAPATRSVPAEKPPENPPPVAGKVYEPAMDTGSGAKTLQVPEFTVPAFLVASSPAAPGLETSDPMSGPLPPLTWVNPSDMPSPELPAAQAPMMEWPTIELTPEQSLPAPAMGYELPAPVLEEGHVVIETAGQDQTDPDPREIAAHSVQDTPTDRALRDALNEVLARRTNLPLVPEPFPSMPEQEPEVRVIAGLEDASPPQVQALPDSEPERLEGVGPDVAPSDALPESASADKELRDHGPLSVSQPEMEPDADADVLAGELSFVRTARRKAFWRKTSVRTSLVLLGLVLIGGLLLQAAVHERRLIVATWPALRPYLEQLCGPLQCDVGPYRQIAAVIVDGSTFQKIKGDQYQFSLTLKNHSATAVEMPAVELTLTDAQDQPVLRRVLTPQDLAAPAELSAQGEWNLAASLLVNLGSTRITGYRVLAFYP